MSDDIDIGALSEALNYKADNDLGNLMDDGENIANWSSNMTNCITKIPQDIKVELNDDGSLTVKAGSIVYIPDGFEQDGVTKKFNKVVITNDITHQAWAGNDKSMLFVKPSTNQKTVRTLDEIFSGTSVSASYLNMGWYDTTNNKIKMTDDSGSTWNEDWSFPLCIVSADNIGFISIDSVFNGFGYICNIVFTLPDVEFLMPDGFNNDGTLKSRRFVTPTVVLDNFITDTTGTSVTYISPSIQAPYFQRYSHYVESEEQPETEYTLWYNPKTNKMYHSESTVEFNEIYRCYVGKVERKDYKVTSLETHKVFNLNTLIDELNGSMRETVIGWLMPNYTAGVSKSSTTTYTAESDGWVLFNTTDAGADFYINEVQVLHTGYGADYHYPTVQIFMPVKTGDTYRSSTTSFNKYAFYPCKGVQ